MQDSHLHSHHSSIPSQEDSKIHIIHGDVYAGLRSLGDNSIDCAITSPPYWSQRDYGFDHQIGNEPTLDAYMQKMLAIYAVLRQKLTKNGVFFHNIGDKYLQKYGNAPLGMIPYRLAYFMVQDGWILEDIIVWYKPNHMPSSVKNRFTNTYEPVFVFVRDQENYYAKYRATHPNHSNCISIPLQTVSYAHMATFPELLVETLLGFGIPKDGKVLDPFGGAGTTGKAVQTLNNSLSHSRECVLIEAQTDFVNIILQRCALSRDVIQKVKFKEYLPSSLPCATPPVYPNQTFSSSSPSSSSSSSSISSISSDTSLTPNNVDSDPQPLIIRDLLTPSDFLQFIPHLFSERYLDDLEDDGLLFVVLPNTNLENLYSVCCASLWVIRNMIVVPIKNTWRPILMLVKDTKLVRYQFHLDNIRMDHQTEIAEKWGTIDFRGYKVVSSAVSQKESQEGLVSQVLARRSDDFPTWLAVKWNDGSITTEEVINPPVPERFTRFFCPICHQQLHKVHFAHKPTHCPHCETELWKAQSTIPTLELNPRLPPTTDLMKLSHEITVQETRPHYNGKFADSSKINRGQSPGARQSVSEQYFAMQRYYRVKQPLFCDYLNLHRTAQGLTKTQLIGHFPPSYKHTVGHWLRKDMGGSLPRMDDLEKLTQILNLDPTYMQYLSRSGLKLQTVLANVHGKNPGDFLNLPLSEVFALLVQLVE